MSIATSPFPSLHHIVKIKTFQSAFICVSHLVLLVRLFRHWPSLLVFSAWGYWSSVHGQYTWWKQSGYRSLQSVYKNYHPCHNPSGGLCQKTAYVLWGKCSHLYQSFIQNRAHNAPSGGYSRGPAVWVSNAAVT